MPDNTDLAFNWGNTPSFWFDITRKSTNESLFSTQNTKIVYENQFLEFVTAPRKLQHLWSWRTHPRVEASAGVCGNKLER